MKTSSNCRSAVINQSRAGRQAGSGPAGDQSARATLLLLTKQKRLSFSLITVAKPILGENWIPVTKHHKSGVHQGEDTGEDLGKGLGRKSRSVVVPGRTGTGRCRRAGV